MNKIVQLFSGTRILEVAESPVNGKIEVIKSLGLGTYIQVAGLTQSGGILYGVWEKPLQKVIAQRLEIRNCLILGLGGGTVAKIVRDFWPSSEITGVDLDPKMIELGRRYLGLDETGVKVSIGDAFDFVKREVKKGKKYDLVLNDVYVGHEIPPKLESENYIHLVRTVLARGGVAIFNRLYYGEKRPQAVKFEEELERYFSKVELVYPKANLMLICFL